MCRRSGRCDECGRAPHLNRLVQLAQLLGDLHGASHNTQCAVSLDARMSPSPPGPNILSMMAWLWPPPPACLQHGREPAAARNQAQPLALGQLLHADLHEGPLEVQLVPHLQMVNVLAHLAARVDLWGGARRMAVCSNALGEASRLGSGSCPTAWLAVARAVVTHLDCQVHVSFGMPGDWGVRPTEAGAGGQEDGGEEARETEGEAGTLGR